MGKNKDKKSTGRKGLKKINIPFNKYLIGKRLTVRLGG